MLPKYGIELTPWKRWENQENPDWWKRYNNVKHERNANFKDANLENTLNAVAGLFCLVLYYYQTELFSLKLDPWTRMLSLEKVPSGLVTGKFSLPDF